MVTSWNCPKCGRWHDLTACDQKAALERFAQLLERTAEMEQATRDADEDLRRYVGRTRKDGPPAAA
ncbi:MAG: hypothetical protein E6I76_08390 [Chloroflexi bacterium]|nr:MAG: hypothetical protein E6I76_08390 [Chloroflexota bacterium]